MDGISSSIGASGAVDFAQMRREMFAKTDTNEDGKLSLEEFEAGKPANAPADAPAGAPKASEMFAELDADGDGYLTESEMENMPPPPNGPPPGGQAMMGGDMLSQLLQALEEEQEETTTEESSSSSSTVASSEEAEELSSSSVEDDVLEIILQELRNYRAASGAYGDAQELTSTVAAQQQSLASL